jgi:glycine/D-amino acid oxidase-like deaminating enzyme/nitrite reductase/ring-hydroxylating ferredoxin subunit
VFVENYAFVGILAGSWDHLIYVLPYWLRSGQTALQANTGLKAIVLISPLALAGKSCADSAIGHAGCISLSRKTPVTHLALHKGRIMKASPWLTVTRRNFPTVSSDDTFDVVVIGGGFAGLTTAHLLTTAGMRVAVLERDLIGGGESSRTTAHLTQVLDLRLKKLVDKFGRGGAQAVFDGGQIAINHIEAIADANNIECDFQRVPGILHGAWKYEPDESPQLQEEVALARELGYEAEFVPNVTICDRAGIRYPQQARIHPLKYIQGLAKLLTREGCKIFEHSEVTDFDEAGFRVRCGDHWLKCGHVVITTHVPLQGRTGFLSALKLQSQIHSYTSYAISAEVRCGRVPDALYWDTSEPYYYLRVIPGNDVDHVIFGGEDHKTGQADDLEQRFAQLTGRLHAFLPEARVMHRWSGQVIESDDGLPYIGPVAERQFVATGFGGNGLTLGTLSGLMAHDLIAGHTNPWSELFKPHRLPGRGGVVEYIRENIDYPLRMIKDRFTPAEGTSVDEVTIGEGKILSLDGQTVACSRSREGEVHVVSAYCTHMGCLVKWNGAEQTWDCPCHGSRFSPDGSVIGGPAESQLPVIEGHTAKARG